MLAIFQTSVASPPPQLTSDERSVSNFTQTVNKFEEVFPDAISLKLSHDTRILFTHNRQALCNPRQFAVSDDIYCTFAGNLENIPQLRQMYGLSKTISEVQLIIEAYKVLRDRGPYTADQVVLDLKGRFTFILYDSACGSVFVAADDTGKLPFFWGTTSDGSLVLTDSAEALKAGCGKSFAPFPPGCYFSSTDGLQSHQHPSRSLKAVRHVDSHGQLCGSTFRVDSQQNLAGIVNESGKDWLNSF